MLRLKYLLLLFLAAAYYQPLKSQQISKDELIFLKPEWKGERFADSELPVPKEQIQKYLKTRTW